MRVIRPLSSSFTITDAMLTSSTVSEPDTGEVAWNPATAYTAGDLAYLASNHTVYERLIGGTTATSPDADTTNWAEYGKTNKWAMFDTYRNSQTTAASPLTVVITPGEFVDSVAIAGMENVDDIVLTVTRSGVEIDRREEDLSTREVLDWEDYFYEPFTTKSVIAFFDIPSYTDAVITITFTADAGDVSVGAVITNLSKYIGTVRPSAVSDVLNFSSVTRDEFGNSEMVQRRNVPKTIQEIIVGKERVNMIRGLRDDLNATPAAWIGMDDSDHDYYEAIFMIGFYKKFSIDMRHPRHAVISLEIEEI